MIAGPAEVLRKVRSPRTVNPSPTEYVDLIREHNNIKWLKKLSILIKRLNSFGFLTGWSPWSHKIIDVWSTPEVMECSLITYVFHRRLISRLNHWRLIYACSSHILSPSSLWHPFSVLILYIQSLRSWKSCIYPRWKLLMLEKQCSANFCCPCLHRQEFASWPASWPSETRQRAAGLLRLDNKYVRFFGGCKTYCDRGAGVVALGVTAGVTGATYQLGKNKKYALAQEEIKNLREEMNNAWEQNDLAAKHVQYFSLIL